MPSVSYERTTGIYTRREENINGNWSSLAGVTFGRAIDKAHRWHIENAMWVTWSDLVWRGQDMNDTESSLQRIRTRHTKVDDKMKLSFRASQKFDVSLNGGIVHGLSWSNLDTYQNVRVTDITYGLAIHCTLPGAVQLSSDFSMLQHSGYEYAAMNANSSVWNVRFDKSLCHDSVTLSLMAYDILDSVQRNTWSISSAGYVNTCYNSLPRYIMLCASYRFYKAKNN